MAKADLQPKQFESVPSNDWSLENIPDVDIEDFDQDGLDEYSFYRDMVPAKLSEVNKIMKSTNSS